MEEIKSIPTLGEEQNHSQEQINEAARLELIRAHERLGPEIDNLTSSSLKRVLKFVIGYSEVNHLVTGEEPSLSKEEEKLVDNLFAFKSSLMGFYALMQENNTDNSNLEEEINE